MELQLITDETQKEEERRSSHPVPSVTLQSQQVQNALKYKLSETPVPPDNSQDLTSTSQIKLSQKGYNQQVFKSIDHSQMQELKKKQTQ